MQNELLAAEIYLSPVNTERATADIDAELYQVEQALKSYSCNASLLEYSTAVLSGLLAGAIDAFLIGETPIFQNNQQPISEQLNEVFNRLRNAFLREDNSVLYGLHAARGKDIPDIASEFIPVLESWAVKTSPLGIVAAVLLQMINSGILQVKKDNVRFFPDDVSKEDKILLASIALIIGLLKWLSDISADERKTKPSSYKMLDKLRDLIRSTPAFSTIVQEMDQWQRHLSDEMKGEDWKKNTDSSIEKAFFSFFTMVISLPIFQNKNDQKAVHILQEAKRVDLRDIPVIHSLSRQGFPVMLNEMIVRTLFFALRLVDELQKNETIDTINWSRILPFGNRDIDRLLVLSTMTLSIADTADAAVHAVIDSYANTAFFATTFVNRFNYVAFGRAAFAVMKEVSNEQAEAELIYRKRILTEMKSQKVIDALQSYQEQLEKRVSEYLTEDITAFLHGFDTMDQGLARKDSDLVIKGNVIIQKTLGRTPQFTNQHEFDELMDSDAPFIL